MSAKRALIVDEAFADFDAADESLAPALRHRVDQYLAAWNETDAAGRRHRAERHEGARRVGTSARDGADDLQGEP